jgi:hypothetical protein
VGTVQTDNKFEKLQNLVPILRINTTTAKEHIPEVESMNQVNQGAGQGHFKYPSIQKDTRAYADRAHLSHYIVLWLITFIAKNNILIEWNEEVGEFPEGIFKVKNVILYPSLAVEHPGVVLE